MLTAHEIAGMRTTSAAAQPDTCTVYRQSGEPVLNEITLDSEMPDAEVIYAGPCRVRPRGSQEQDVEVGDLHETLGPYVGTLPALSTVSGITEGDPNGIRVDDFLSVTASTDPSMTGRTFRVVHVGWSSWQLDRRLGLEDRQQPIGGVGTAS